MIALLKKIGASTCGANEQPSLLDALDTYKSDQVNHAKIKAIFVESLRLDVLVDLNAVRKAYSAANATWVQKGREVVRAYRAFQASLGKALVREKKSQIEAAEAREKYCEAKLAPAGGAATSASTLLKLGKAAVNAMSEATEARRTLQQVQTKFQLAYSTFEPVMTEVLNALHQNEESRVDAIKTALQRQLVIETSFLSGRQYDTQNQVKVMEDVNAKADISAFVQIKLQTVASEIEPLPILESDGEPPRPPPYIPQSRKVKKTRRPDLVDELTSWMSTEEEQKVMLSFHCVYVNLFLNAANLHFSNLHSPRVSSMWKLNLRMSMSFIWVI